MSWIFKYPHKNTEGQIMTVGVCLCVSVKCDAHLANGSDGKRTQSISLEQWSLGGGLRCIVSQLLRSSVLLCVFACHTMVNDRTQCQATVNCLAAFLASEDSNPNIVPASVCGSHVNVCIRQIKTL